MPLVSRISLNRLCTQPGTADINTHLLKVHIQGTYLLQYVLFSGRVLIGAASCNKGDKQKIVQVSSGVAVVVVALLS